MPKITIDGQECEFDGKQMILQVALDQGAKLPHYCYHPGLSVVASCRICLAEVFAPNPKNDNKLEPWPPGPGGKLVPTCQSPALDGMVVNTQTPKAIANQKTVMELLLVNHPLDCPVCDQAGECSLQDYSYDYGRAQSRFEEDKAKQPKKDVGPNVWLYSDRCIMCSRCVRFTREVSGTGELAVFGRGHTEEIDVFPGKPLDNELSGNVVDLCPVGALLDKDFLFSQRVWFLTKTPSIDGITASGDNISVEHNEGQVYRVKPRTNMEVNKWWISDEIRYGWKFVQDPKRLRSPMRKQHGVAEECDWNQAYKTIGERFKSIVAEHGTGSLAVMVSPMLSCEDAYLLGRMIRAVDSDAVLSVGPIPRDGQDKPFPGGYVIHAEKAPNARGVRRALEQVGVVVRGYDEFQSLVSGDSKIKGVVVTGGYPSDWVTDDLMHALEGKFTVAVDVLPNRLTDRADVVLPGATWVEKSGTFENASNRLQTFMQAIPVIELAKPEGQIALDLVAACDQGERAIYDAAAVREQLGGPFVADVHHPVEKQRVEADMEYVEL